MSFQAIEAPAKPEHLPEFLSREMHRLERELRDGAKILPTFAGTWANVGTPYAVVAYTRDHHMRVHLEGVAQSGARVTDSYTLVITLPERYRPLNTEVFSCTQGTDGEHCRVDVASDGGVRAWKWNGTWLSLSGVSYRAER